MSIDMYQKRPLPQVSHLSARLRVQAENAISMYLDDALTPDQRKNRAESLERIIEIFRVRPRQGKTYG